MKHLLLLLLATLPHLAAAGYPARQDPWVNDEAAMLGSADRTAVRQMLQDFHREHHIEATVVTVPSLGSYGSSPHELETFATELFNHWGIGDQARNDGLLLLVSKADRKMRIEVGSGYGRRLDQPMKRVLDTVITPQFRSGNFSAGIRAGVVAMLDVVGAPAAVPPPPEPLAEAPLDESPPPVVPESTAPDDHHRSVSVSASRDINPLAVGGGTAATGLLGWGLSRFLRYRRRKCPQCQAQLQLLTEPQDDIHLDDGQKVEEAIGSVDYDVWCCPRCQHREIRPYRAWFSGYEDCPSCSYRTVKRDTRVLVYADYDSPGRQLVTRQCQRCQFHSEQTVILPRKTRSSSSSGTSSFSSSGSSGGSSSGGGSSGGRSSGGGASGGW